MNFPRLVMLTTLLLAGCEQNGDERVQWAEEAVQAQREENRMVGEQNTRLMETTLEVTQQGQALAKAAEKLVEKDSEARREMIVAHKEMRHELHTERSEVDRHCLKHLRMTGYLLGGKTCPAMTTPRKHFMTMQPKKSLPPDRFLRQQDLIPAAKLATITSTVIGVGAIGRQVA